jgi:hypothetical protein
VVSKKIHFIFIFYFMALMGLISLHLGRDVNWDLRNYHYYIGYAFLNISPIQDFFAAGVVSYLNPLTDVMNYLMIKHLPPKLTGFLLGAVQGLNLYFLWAMALRLTSSVNSSIYRAIAVLAIPTLGLLCANVIGEIGTTFNDLTLASWVLLSLLIIGFSLQKDIDVHKKLMCIFLAGCSLGIAIGLKLTIALYFTGALIALITLKSRGDFSQFKLLSLFLLGGILGFLLVNGYWMAVLWKFFHNPIFPYYNHFFKSPYYYAKNIVDVRYFPHNWLQTLFYPFYFSWQPCLTSDAPFRDFRMPVIYSLLIIYCGKIFITKNKCSEYYNLFQREYVQFLIIFFVVSYIIWQYQFSIQRYAMVLDILSPLIIYLLITNIFNNQLISHCLVLFVFILLAVTLKPQNWGRFPWTKNYFTVEIPQTIDLQRKSVVINVDFGVSFLRAFFPKDWHFMSAGLPWFPSNTCFPYADDFNIHFPAMNPLISPWFQDRQKYNYYVLFLDTPESTIENIVKQYQFRLEKPCSIIQAKIQNYFICPLVSSDDVP